MPQHVKLSNGYPLDIPDGMTGAQIKDRVDHMESLINPQWKGFGNLSDAAETTRNLMSYVTNPAGRIAAAGLNLNPVVGGIDLGVGGVNAIKAIAVKHYSSLANTPDIPTVSELAADTAGVTPSDPNASTAQRYAESALTGILNPKQALSTSARMIGSTFGGDTLSALLSYYAGPEYEKAGRWLGSVAGASPDQILTAPARWFAGKQAPASGAAGQQLQTQPTFGAVASPGGRLFEKALGAMPLVGLPINAARQRMEDAIQNTRNAAATDINQGSLPTQVDPNSIGGNLITLARTRSASIKQDASQRYQDLYNVVPKDTLVDGSPVLQAIIRQSQDPGISGAQKEALLARAAYMQTMFIGQPGYNGPPPAGRISNPNLMTMGQLAAFKTELGDDVQGMTGIDQRVHGQVYNAIDDVMQHNFNQLGYGTQYQQARDNYARVMGPGSVTEALDAVGGAPVRGKPGMYAHSMTEQQAHDFLQRSTQSPSALEPFVDPNNPYWRATAAQFVSRLGNAPQGDFRGDTFAKQMEQISPEVLSQLAQAPNGGMLQPTVDNLRAAQQLGQESTVAPRRHGLTSSIGSFAATEAAIHWLGNHFANMGLPADTALPVAMAVAYGMQSKPVVDAMSGTGGSTPLTDALYTGFPTAAASLALNNPDDPRNQPPPPPPSPVPGPPTQQ